MTLEEILIQWEKDSDIDISHLQTESVKSSKLHCRYIRILSSEEMILKAQETQLQTLKKEKIEFYTQGETKETREKGWKLPPRGVVLKVDADTYVSSDPEYISLSLKIGLQQEKVYVLKDILKTIHKRSYDIANAINFIRFQNGD